MTNYSFKKGWEQLPIGKMKEARSRIMEALAINTRMAFLTRLNGKVEPKVTEYQKLIEIFKSYGITEIWDN